jgi:type I restriction enzyme S subunit
MDVRPGYKQTEFGVTPEEWHVKPIGELIDEQSILGHLDGNHGELYPRSHEFKSYGVPYIGANDFDQGNVTFDRCKFLSAQRAAQFRKGVARDGDVLFAHNATVGPVALLRTTREFVILSTTATYFRCNPDRLSNEYLKGALQSEFFVKQYQAVMAQSTRFQVPITAQRKLSLLVPPLPEQRAIAKVLTDVDALLDALDRLIAKKRDLKQAAMQQLLTGQTRLPGFTGEWEKKRIANIAPLQRGFDLPNSSLRPGKYPVVYSNGIVNFHAEAPVQGPGVITGRSGTIGNVTFIDGPFWPHNTALWVTSFKGNNPRFVFYLYTNVGFEQFATGSGVLTLNRNDVHAFEVAIPPTLDEQIAIAAVLSDMDAELAALEKRLAKTSALKQGMMQELLTGKTRIVGTGVVHA